jgi:hypothetical protein
MDKKLPIYQLTIGENDHTGVDFVSLVERPAIEVNWVAFNEDKPLYTFSQDAEKRFLSGPFLIPDLPIYRRNDRGEEFYVVFTKETIEKIVKKFFKNEYTGNINYEHIPDSKIANTYVVESWIVSDAGNDKSKHLGFSLPEGTWFGTVHIESEEYWERHIKSGDVKGFSVEGFLNMVELDNDSKTKNKNEQTEMSKTKLSVTAIDGTVLSYETLAEGAEIFVIDADGNPTPASGSFELEDGTLITAEDGKITAITEKPAATEELEETETVETSELEAIVARITEMAAAMQALEARLVTVEDQLRSAEAVNEELSTQLSELKKLPGAKSMLNKTDVDTKKTTPEDLISKVRAFRK